jgi:hypothetical protein
MSCIHFNKYYSFFASCAPAWEDPANLSYTWYLMIVGFFIPLAIILYTSADVLYLLNKVSKPQTANRKPQTANRKPQTANRKPQTANRKPQTANRTPHTKHHPAKLQLYFFGFYD